MIHTLFNLARPLFVLDTETTGTDPQAARIIEIGFQRWDATGMTKEWRTLVNPEEPISISSMKVHGITDHLVQSCRYCQMSAMEHPVTLLNNALCETFVPWPAWRHLGANLAKGLVDCDFAGKHVRFDLRVMAAEMARVHVPWSYAGARIVDIDRLEQIAIPRSLSDLHAKYVGYPHDGAHGALSDVRASTTIIVKQLEVHEQLPRDLEALHKLQWKDWIDTEGKFKFVDGVPCFAFGKHRDKPMRDVPIDYYDYLLKNDFSDEVKQLAANAKLGRYPEPS